MPLNVRATIQDWLDMPEDGNIYELIDGRMYMNPPPVPRHQRILTHLNRKVGGWAEQCDLGRWYQSPCGVVLGDGTGVQPDAFLICKGRIHILEGEKLIHGAPDLVVEVLSPSTARRDRIVKLQTYAVNGVREYWIIDPVAICVTVYELKGDLFEEAGSVSGDRRIPSLVLPDLEVRAHELFAD